jgi:pyridinium-3,5-biscarboxylic acid mononucleotide synthase
MTRDSECDLGFAKVDLSRPGRCGRPEVIFGGGKLPVEVAEIARALREAGQSVLATRVGADHFEAVASVLPDAQFHERARCVTVGAPAAASGHRDVAVVCAGTSDLPVAEEACVCLRFYGRGVTLVRDVGVAGLHRLLARVEEIRSHRVVVVVAGMEGALPSAVAGLVALPVIAVPTSIGYGANLGGLAALLGMLTSCGSGVTVVNIDNGFGAAAAADRILAMPRDPCVA